MEAAQVILLSSSPIRPIQTSPPPSNQYAALSSSPSLPSPSHFLGMRDSLLKSGSKVVPIPNGVNVGFTSSSSLLKRLDDSVSIDGTYASETSVVATTPDSDVKPPAKKQTRKRTKASTGGSNESEKKPRSRKKKLEDAGDGESNGTNEKAKPAPKPRKPRAKKTTADSQTKIPKGKVTKPGVSRSRKAQKSSKESTPFIEDASIDKSEGSVEPGTGAPIGEILGDLSLDAAVKRRDDWTPPRESFIDIDTIGVTNSQSPSIEGSKNSFGNLLSGFEYKSNVENGPKPSISRATSGEAPTKRRRIEFIETNQEVVQTNSEPEPPEKAKAPRKKPATITARVTALYAQRVGCEESTESSLLNYFGTKPRDSDLPNSNTIENAKPKSKKKAPAKARRSKKSVAAQNPLLSPKSALKALENQDLLFGTSSQLAGEDDPAFIRDMRQALKESEEIIPICSSHDSRYRSANSESSSFSSSRFARLTSSKKLWSEAARDFDGSLLHPEVINLTDSPTAAAVISTLTNAHGHPTVTSMDAEQLLQSEGWKVLSDEESPLAPRYRSEDGPPVLLTIPQQSDELEQHLHPTTKENPAINKLITNSNHVAPAPTKPDFHGYTTNRLMSELESYHFKPLKNRNQMIELLERCWESKHQPVLQPSPNHCNLLPIPVDNQKPEEREIKLRATKKSTQPALAIEQPNVIPTTSSVTALPTKKPRGRPRKASMAPSPPASPTKAKMSEKAAKKPPTRKASSPRAKLRKVLPVEIEDSDNDSIGSPIGSPVNTRSRSPTSQSAGLGSLAVNRCCTPELDLEAAQQHIFSQIKKAIKTYPPSNSATSLSWHEKILIYDPIVLEDLTSWLNTVGFREIGIDKEISALEVRDWCESESICCLWKENLRGRIRARF